MPTYINDRNHLMNYRTARKLHNEDEVIRKDDGESLYVVSTKDNRETKTVMILCNDGQEYHHTEVK